MDSISDYSYLIMGTIKYKVPPPFTVQKPYSRQLEKVKAWEKLTDLDAKNEVIAVVLSLLRKDIFNQRCSVQ